VKPCWSARSLAQPRPDPTERERNPPLAEQAHPRRPARGRTHPALVTLAPPPSTPRPPQPLPPPRPPTSVTPPALSARIARMLARRPFVAAPVVTRPAGHHQLWIPIRYLPCELCLPAPAQYRRHAAAVQDHYGAVAPSLVCKSLCCRHPAPFGIEDQGADCLVFVRAVFRRCRLGDVTGDALRPLGGRARHVACPPSDHRSSHRHP